MTVDPWEEWLERERERREAADGDHPDMHELDDWDLADEAHDRHRDRQMEDRP